MNEIRTTPREDGLLADHAQLREALASLCREYERIGGDREREAYQVALNTLTFTTRRLIAEDECRQIARDGIRLGSDGRRLDKITMLYWQHMEVLLETARQNEATLRARCERLEAALRGLHFAAETLASHASETYPHFEDTRGQKDIAATHEALEVSSAALAGEGGK